MFIRLLNYAKSYCKSSLISAKMKYLCVAEKNDAAKTISSILSKGNSQRREGFSQYNKIYEFDMDIFGQNSKIVFTSVSGHLLNRDFSTTFKNWRSCSPEQLFEAPVMKLCPESYVNIKKTLEREVKSCNGLIIWTDCDREGENIGFEIIEVCKAVKPSISVYRARFSDMTAPSLRRAINTLGPPDEKMSQAVDVRSELDLRIGAAFTRFQTMRLQSLFPENINNDLVSYGSCQFPTLGFVADRYREIEKFIPSDFWKIKMTHTKSGKTVEYNWSRNRLFDKRCVQALLAVCKNINLATVKSVQTKPKSKWRPQAMDTIELEKSGSRKLKLSAKEIMTIAEKLYTQGFISYPRTETNQFSKDINLRQFVEMQTADQNWGDFASKVLEWGPSPRNGKKSDQAHPPIHPTKFTNSLSGNDKRVYELIVRHFLACVSRDALGSETTVVASIGEEEVIASGLIIFEENYLEVYIYEKWSEKNIHAYQMGETFVPTILDLHEGKTSAPNLLTEADLIALMDKHGIGTDATHAEHIATVKERGYIGEIDRGYLVPGTLGMGLVEGYELMNLQLSQPQLRAALEKDLKAICDGVKQPADVLRQQIEIYKECYQVVTRQVNALDRAIGNRFGTNPQNENIENSVVPALIIHELFKCPKCRKFSTVLKLKKDQRPYIGCQGYPTCTHAIWLDQNVKSITSIDELCTSCGGGNHKVKIKFSQNYLLAEVDEVPAYSRIDSLHYITCLYCDSKVRQVLNIKAEDVKVLGNMVGAASNPIHQATYNARGNNNQGGQQQQPRTFNGNIANNQNDNDRPQTQFRDHSLQRRNWFSDQDDNHRPSGGGGGGAVASNPLASIPDTNCDCNRKAIKMITRKEGPNKGRPFYKCDKCKFFQWADTPPPPRRNPNLDSSGNNAGGGASAARKCGLCRQSGHNRKNCPNNRSSL